MVIMGCKMKNRICILFTIVLALLITSCTFNQQVQKKKANDNIVVENNEEIATSQNNVLNISDYVVTMRDIADFLETKSAHYPFSDEFVERYQQKDGGYIENARKAGLLVDKYRHEPNQKWHFFDSWLYPSIEEGTLSWDDTAQNRVYSKLLCPELLLWIYEACEVDPIKVRDAKIIAEDGKAKGNAVTTIAKNMRSIVAWEDLEVGILDFLNSDTSKYNATFITGDSFEIVNLKEQYREGAIVNFEVIIKDNTKQIDTVKVNDQLVEAISGNKYQFTMPGQDISVTVTLKDREKVPATSASFSQKSLELYQNSRSKKITVSALPLDTTDNPIFSIIEGDNIVSISSIGNEITIMPLNIGTARIKVTYNANVSDVCTIIVNEPSSQTYSTYYNIKYDLGTRVQAVALSNAEDVFKLFTTDSEEESIISSIDQFEKVYGGGNGGSGDNKWYSGNILKVGTATITGSITMSLNDVVKGVIITGYAHKTSCNVRVGDPNSLDFGDTGSDNKTQQIKCGSSMNVASLDVVNNKQVVSVTFNQFEPTDQIKIVASTALYITSIEFILED